MIERKGLEQREHGASKIPTILLESTVREDSYSHTDNEILMFAYCIGSEQAQQYLSASFEVSFGLEILFLYIK